MLNSLIVEWLNRMLCSNVNVYKRDLQYKIIGSHQGLVFTNVCVQRLFPLATQIKTICFQSTDLYIRTPWCLCMKIFMYENVWPWRWRENLWRIRFFIFKFEFIIRSSPKLSNSMKRFINLISLAMSA